MALYFAWLFTLLDVLHDLTILIFSVSSANAAPEFEGRGGEDLASDITNMMRQAYADPNTLDMKSLCVAERQHCWILYIDILVSVKLLISCWYPLHHHRRKCKVSQ